MAKAVATTTSAHIYMTDERTPLLHGCCSYRLSSPRLASPSAHWSVTAIEPHHQQTGCTDCLSHAVMFPSTDHQLHCVQL